MRMGSEVTDKRSSSSSEKALVALSHNQLLALPDNPSLMKKLGKSVNLGALSMREISSARSVKLASIGTWLCSKERNTQ